jgi:heme exporter protein C
VKPWQLLVFLWVTVTIIAGFLWAPLAQKLEEYTRIMYFHIPAAWVSVVAFATAGYAAIRYLGNRDPIQDARSLAAVRLGLVFCVLATVTGMLWAKAMWGAYWNWDPRQVSIFFLILIYGAYLTLRAAVEDPDRRARLAAVYALLAFVTVPFLMFVAPRMSSFSLHPDPIINESGKMDMHPRMLGVFLSAAAAFTVLFYWMLSIEVRIARSELAGWRRRSNQKQGESVERTAGV